MSPAWRTHVAAGVVGATAAALVALGQRTLAPFCGTQWDARTALSGSVLLGLAAGLVVGSLSAGRGGPARSGLALLAAAAWLLPWPWLRQPILRLVEPAGLPGATLFAAAALALVPAVAMGIAGGQIATRHARRSGAPAASALRLVALALACAWAAAALVPVLLIPHLGAGRSLLGLAFLLVAAAYLVQDRGGTAARDAGRTGLALLALAATSLALWRAPGVHAAPEFGLRSAEEGAAIDLRALDRDEVRYLLVDGLIVNVADPVTGSSLERGPAALRITGQLYAAPGRALVLGMRGGAIPTQLARQGWAVTVVEPEPRLAAAATREFGLGRAEVAVVGWEPRRFLRRTASRFDCVVLDISGAGAPCGAPLGREFFALVRARLAPPQGVFALAVEAQGWEDVLVRSLAATLRGVFAHVVALPTAEPPDQLGCVVLLASDRSLELADEALPDVGAVLGDSYLHWVVMQQNHAWFNRYEPGVEGARILTDDRHPLELWAARLERAARRDVHAYFGPYAHAW